MPNIIVSRFILDENWPIKKKRNERKNNDEELFLKYFAVLSCIHLCHSIWLINSIVITALRPQNARKWRAVGPLTGYIEFSVPTYFFYSTVRNCQQQCGGEMYTQRLNERILFLFFTFLSKCSPKESSLMCIWFCLINLIWWQRKRWATIIPSHTLRTFH